MTETTVALLRWTLKSFRQFPNVFTTVRFPTLEVMDSEQLIISYDSAYLAIYVTALNTATSLSASHGFSSSREIRLRVQVPLRSRCLHPTHSNTEQGGP